MRRFGLWLLVALLIVKVIGVIARGPSPLVLDAGEYWALGERVAGGDVLLMGEAIAYRTPGYPWLVGAVQAVFPQPLFVLVCLQGVLWLGTIGWTALIARDLSERPQAVAMVLAAAVLMVSSVTYTATVLTETLFTFLLMAHLWSVERYARAPSVVGGVWVGLTLGLTILTRPVAMLLWVADAIYLSGRWCLARRAAPEKPPWRRRLAGVAVAVVVAVACVSPWLARNRALFGRAMLTEFVGRNVWIVTFQDGSGAGLGWPQSDAGDRLARQLDGPVWDGMIADGSWRHTWTVSRALTAAGLDDPTADRLMKQVAVDAIAEAPVVFARKAGRRWVNFWRTRATDLPPQAADLSPRQRAAMAAKWGEDPFAGREVWGVKVAPIDTALRVRWSNWLTGNTLLMFVTVAAVMLLLGYRDSRAAGLWLAAILGYFSGITAALEIPDYRYRLIVEPIVLVAIVAAAAPILFSPDPHSETRTDA